MAPPGGPSSLNLEMNDVCMKFRDFCVFMVVPLERCARWHGTWFLLLDHWPTISYHAILSCNHHPLLYNLTRPPFQLISFDVTMPRDLLTRNSLFVFRLRVSKLTGHLQLIKPTFSYSYTFIIFILRKECGWGAIPVASFIWSMHVGGWLCCSSSCSGMCSPFLLFLLISPNWYVCLLCCDVQVLASFVAAEL